MCHAEVGERFPLSVSIFFLEKGIYLIFSSPFKIAQVVGCAVSVRKGVWEGVKQGKRPRRPRMRTCRNPFEKSKSKQTEFFVREVKDKRMTKNGPEFLIGWRDFPLERDDTWEPTSNLTGSEHRICEFQKQHTLDYEMKTAAVKLQLY